MCLACIETQDALADFRSPSIVVVRLTCGLNTCQDPLRKRVSLIRRQLCRDLGEIIDRLNHGCMIMRAPCDVQSAILSVGSLNAGGKRFEPPKRRGRQGSQSRDDGFKKVGLGGSPDPLFHRMAVRMNLRREDEE